MDFAVTVPGQDPAQGYWVLAIDTTGGRFLIAVNDKDFKWVPISKCTLFRAASPDAPRLVIPVTPTPRKDEIVVPGPQLLKPNGRG